LFKTIFLFALITIPSFSYADSLLCGGAVVTVSDAESDRKPFFIISIEGKSNNKTLNFEIQKDFLYLRCEKTATGKPVLFINHFCGGSGCTDFGNFGIIEARTGIILLEPNQPFKGNMEKAKQIMGKELKPFTCEKDNSEICLHTKIVLGQQVAPTSPLRG
jgi:hypothetical protein